MKSQPADVSIDWDNEGMVSLTFYQRDEDKGLNFKFRLADSDLLVQRVRILLTGYIQSRRMRSVMGGLALDGVHYLNVAQSVCDKIAEIVVDELYEGSREKDWDWYEDPEGFRLHTVDLHRQKNAGNLFEMCGWLMDRESPPAPEEKPVEPPQE